MGQIKALVIVAFNRDQENAIFYRKLKLGKLTMQQLVDKVAMIINNGILNDADFFSLRVVKEA